MSLRNADSIYVCKKNGPVPRTFYTYSLDSAKHWVRGKPQRYYYKTYNLDDPDYEVNCVIITNCILGAVEGYTLNEISQHVYPGSDEDEDVTEPDVDVEVLSVTTKVPNVFEYIKRPGNPMITPERRPTRYHLNVI